MAILRRANKEKRDKNKPEVVTGDFELHYEDVINRNRYALIALFSSGLVLLAVFVPSAMYHSVADTKHVSVEAERGTITNADKVLRVDNDMSASGNGYLEFRLNTPE